MTATIVDTALGLHHLVHRDIAGLEDYG